jgi:gliding motility-associated-like protein
LFYGIISIYIKNKYNILVALKKRILYIILGVMLFAKVGLGQSFTLAANSYSVSSSPINYNCASVTFDCNNNTSSSLVYDVYSSSTGLPGSFNLIFSNTVSPNNISQLTFYNQGTIYYYAEINSSPLITSSVYQVEIRNRPSRPTITSNTPICEGATLTFNATTVSGGTFSWTGVNGFSSSLQNPSISSATSASTGNYSATVTVNGCTSPSSTISSTVNVRPTATLTLSPSPIGKNPICFGEDVNLRLDVVSSGTWSLTLSDNSVASGVASRTDFTPLRPNSNITYSIASLSDANCNSILSDLSGTVAITVNALPVINSLMDTTKVCGTKTILDAGAGYSSYSWSNGSTSRYISTDVSQNYFVTVKNASSCSSIDSTFLSIVDAKLFNSDTTILAGASVNINAHGILNSADRAVLYDFSNANALNDFVTLTTSSGTVSITTSGETGKGVELVRASNCCSDAEMKTTRENFGYGTYEVDAYSASGIADQSFGIMEQSGSWVNRVLKIGTRPNGTDNQGWDVVFKGINIASSNTSPVSNSTWYKIKVYITPTTLKVWLNTTVLFDGALPSAITNPRGAIRVGAYDVSRYDNIKYTPLQELSYLWTTSSTNQNITVTPTVTSTYQLKVTDQTTTCNSSVDIRVLKINIINTDASICNNTSQILSIDSSFSKYASWQTKNPGIEFYNIKKDLNGNLYALPSLNNQKIYKSIDRGETWNQMAGFPSLGSNNFMALGVDQNNVIYASTNHDGIYKSIDEGVTWTQLQDFGFGCGPMDILFGNNFSILTVKGSNRGIWSSTGDLFSWQKKVGGFDPNTVTQDKNGNLYAGGNSAGGKVLYKSSDIGATWTNISNLYGVQIIRADSNGKVFLIEGGASAPLYVSDNQGVSFSPINTLSLPNSGISYPEDILFTKNNMFISKGQIYYSKDNGVNFTQLDKISFPTAGIFNYGPGGAPSGNYGDSSNRMEMIGNRLFVATLDGIKFIDTDNLNTTVTWSTGEVGNKIIVNPIATSPGTTTSYSATVSYGSITGSDQVTFTLPTKPTISASGPTTFCAGGTVTLTANSSPSGVYSYTWQTGAITQGINVASSGSYTVTAVNSNGCSETSIPTIITVNALPTISIVETDASGTTVNDNIICVGGSATLTASGGASYLWNTSETAASITKSPVTTTSYTVTGTNANGCENTATQAITVNALPTISIVETDASGTTVNDNIICVGGSATLTASGGASYLWNTSETAASITKIPVTTTSYTVTGTNANGCENTATQAITVNALPTISIVETDASGTTVNDNIICVGGSATLTASGGASYLWNTSETIASITKTPVTTTSYTVTGTNANGCENTATQVITVNALPAAPVANSASLNYNGLLQTTPDLIPPSGQSISWFTASVGGVNSSKPQGINVGTYNSYANAMINATGCISSSRTLVFLTINKAPLTITATPGQTKVYGATDPSIYAYILSAPLFGTDALSGALTRVAGETVGPYAINQGTLANTNYDITYVGNNFTITQKPITITVDPNQTKVYGTANPATYTYGVSPSLIGLATLNGSLTRVAGEPVGTYAIQQNDLTTANNPNYTITYVGNNFTITQKPITITVDPNQTKVYGTANPATYTYAVSPSLTGLATLNGSLTRLAGEPVGTYAIQQNDLTTANNPNYTITYVGDNFTITTAPLSITGITGANKIYDGTTIATINGTASYIGLVAADAGLAVTGTPSFNFNNKNVGIAKPITVAGFTAPSSNYSLTQPTGFTGDITPKTVNVIADANDKQYDGNTTATLNNITSPGFISGDLVTINYASATFDTKEVGNNKTVTVTGINLTSTDAPNYVLASSTATALANITAPPVFIFEVPNAFTPNGDGLNDLLKIISNAGIIELRSFKIFSRSGNLVFESRDLSKGWDGRFNGNLLQVDLYYWTAVYVDRNNVVNSKNGTILLLK